VPGNGRGPTARWINPHPRDFRAGLFKFQSINKALDGQAHPPSRGDLMRTLRQGIEGTAMPSFNLLSDDQLESLISYVIHLSIRGQVEMKMMKHQRLNFNDNTGTYDKWLDQDEEGITLSFSEAVKQETSKVLKERQGREERYKGWIPSQDPANAIAVAPYPYQPGDLKALKESVKRGQMLFTANPSKEFLDEYRDRLIKQEIKNPADLTEAKKKEFEKRALSITKIGCISCHVDYGRQAKFRYDLWGTLVRPNNFTLGVFRGGHRPVDMYYRIHSGINGSEMTPFGKDFQPQDIWDLVNFVSNLSYPAMRRELGINID
jgi:mono/diheme cytochrome c family protein